MTDKPFIPAETVVGELTFRAVILGVLLTLILAMSNAYLALKLGILTSASIPAAIISMGILRFFKNSTILENNAVQTAASAGEAVAGGIVYTIPALVIIGYWHHFDYFTNFFIAAAGGILGVLFSIPLRRLLVHDQGLKFPEGRAIAEVLKSSMQKLGIRDIFWGGIVGASLELLQVGFKFLASGFSYWFSWQKSLMGFGLGFSPTMIGAGYLVGQGMAVSIFSGAVITWVLALPVVSAFYPELALDASANETVVLLWNSKLRYMGIGAMLFAGIWTFILLVRPLLHSIQVSFRRFHYSQKTSDFPRTERDIALPYILTGVAIVAVFLFLFFQYLFPFSSVGFAKSLHPTLIFGCVFYVLVIGFLFSVITAYFSGMVGVTASPGSSIVIAGMLFAAWLLMQLMDWIIPLPFSPEQLQAAEAITIVIGSVVTGIAAIANDNTQDLKVGHLVGATPWKQQLMLLLGVIVAASVIPPVMQVLYDVYGIAGSMPHPGMDPSLALPAPTAALMAAITQAVFSNTLPWTMILLGGGIILVVLAANKVFQHFGKIRVSILGVAIGMYLPLASSFPLFLGGMIAWIVHRRLLKTTQDQSELLLKSQKGVLIGCGLVAGSAVLDVLLALLFSVFQSPDALSLVSAAWLPQSVILSLFATLALAYWIVRRVA